MRYQEDKEDILDLIIACGDDGDISDLLDTEYFNNRDKKEETKTIEGVLNKCHSLALC